MFRIVPREEGFFDMFELAARNVHAAALSLSKMLEDFHDGPVKSRHIEELEHEGDGITHDTIMKLHQTFITPIHREYIHQLISKLDDIIDLINTAASRIILYKIEEPTEDSKAMAKVLTESTLLLVDLLPRLRNTKKKDDVFRLCIDIHTKENDGDRLNHQALASLFDNGFPTPLIVKWKDIYGAIEAANDRCEDVANIVEGVLLENA